MVAKLEETQWGNSKLPQKFIGPYQVMEAYSNHTYLIGTERGSAQPIPSLYGGT